MNHFHLRFTPAPRGLQTPPITNYDLSGMCQRFDKIVCAYETKNKEGKEVIPHYHVYGETSYQERSTRDFIRDILNVPKTTKGKGSAYTTLEWNKYKDPNPEYVCKWGDIKIAKGYEQTELDLYTTNGVLKYLKSETTPKEEVIYTSGREAKEDNESRFLRYIKDVLPANHDESNFTLETLKWKTREWFHKKSWLPPPKSERLRYIEGAWNVWCMEYRNKNTPLSWKTHSKFVDEFISKD